MASDGQPLDTTFRCAVCRNRTGFEDARIIQAVWTCSRCANAIGLQPRTAERRSQDDWLEGAHEERTHVAEE